MKELTMSEVEEVSGGRGRRRSGNRPSGGFQVSSGAADALSTASLVMAVMGPVGFGCAVVLNWVSRR
jgi:hypothetical protein